MSTTAQIAANIENAKHSTGPKTAEGKAASSKNGVTLGLFTGRDFISPPDQQPYADLTAQLNRELAPVGLLETNLVGEIRHALWRLRRCATVEAHLALYLTEPDGVTLDPMEIDDPRAVQTQRSVDRARSQAHRLLHKCTTELRRLQTDRRFAEEIRLEHDNNPVAGIADLRAVVRAYVAKLRNEPQTAQADPVAQPVTMRTQSDHPMAA